MLQKAKKSTVACLTPVTYICMRVVLLGAHLFDLSISVVSESILIIWLLFVIL
jgi:hypothetical protein